MNICRYYLEMDDEEHIVYAVVQGEQGIFYVDLNGDVCEYFGFNRMPYWIKMPESEPVEIRDPSDRRLLEYIRQFERSSYTRTWATEIREEASDVKEFVVRVFKRDFTSAMPSKCESCVQSVAPVAEELKPSRGVDDVHARSSSRSTVESIPARKPRMLEIGRTGTSSIRPVLTGA